MGDGERAMRDRMIENILGKLDEKGDIETNRNLLCFLDTVELMEMSHNLTEECYEVL